MKLGIKIVFTDEGVQNGPVFNEDGALKKYAQDVRPFLRKVFPTREELRETGLDPLSSFDESSKIVYLLQFIDRDGYMLTVIKAGPEQTGRTFDNTAVWIHVPHKLNIEANELVYILKEIGNIISASYDLDETRIQRIAEKEYPENTSLLPNYKSQGEKVGVFLYGKGSRYELSEILGKSIRQPSFATYKGLFLVDSDLGLTLKENVEAKVKVQKIITLDNPQEFDGFKPYIGPVPFDRPVELTKDSSLAITWKQKGYCDIIKDLSVSEDIDLNTYHPRPDEELVIFHRYWFEILANQSGELLPNAIVAINNKPFIEESLAISRENIKQGFDLKVSCEGYNDCDTFVTPNKFSKIPIQIRLKQASYQYEFTLTAYDADGTLLQDQMDAVLKTKSYLNSSPIKGYKIKGNRNEGYLRPNTVYHLSFIDNVKNSIKLKIQYFCLGFIAAILLLGIGYGITYFFEHYEFVLDLPPIQEKTIQKKYPKPYQDLTSPDSTNPDLTKIEGEKQIPQGENNGTEATLDTNFISEDIAQAICYLDNNQNWDKDRMEQFESLKGLFDDMNSFKLNELNGKWATKLLGSNNFNTILIAVKNNLYKGWNPQNDKENGLYNPPGDKIIKIANYIKWLSCEHISQNGVQRPRNNNSDNAIDKQKDNTSQPSNTRGKIENRK